MFNTFDIQKVDLNPKKSFYYPQSKTQNFNGDSAEYSTFMKKANRTEYGAIPKIRPGSIDNKQSYSGPKPTKAFRITRRFINETQKGSDTMHFSCFPRTWDNNIDIVRLGCTENSSRASPENFIHKILSQTKRTKTSPVIDINNHMKTLKVAIADIGEALGKDANSKPLREAEPDYFLYVVGKGNNDQIIRKVMQKRYWWRETYNTNNSFHFSWQPVSRSLHFDRLYMVKGMRQVVNHYEFHSELSTKIGLIRNLQAYCEKVYMDVFDITPTTFILDLEDPNFMTEFQEFISFFQKYSKNASDRNSQLGLSFPLAYIKPFKTNSLGSTQSSLYSKHSQPKMQETLYSGSNLWLLKPAELNRGRGISLFNKLSTLESQLKSYQMIDSSQKHKSPPMKKQEQVKSPFKMTKFVVQKYLERPMLIDGRKFDIRVWVLLDHQMNLYYFKEGYIRLSSETFSLNENHIEDKFVHLTNNAIQKDGKNYGKHESGNIISLQQLRNYLPKDKSKTDYVRIVERMKDLIRVSMKSAKEKLNAKERKYCFEIFGFDFMIDQLYNVWLIEINTNPCLEESNELLKRLVPRMLDDAFKLTLDKLIVPTPKNFKPEDSVKAEAFAPFSVGGYDNNENLWEHLANLRAAQIYCKLK